jgi:hypothetical protein
VLEAHVRHILARVAVTDDDAKRAKKLADRVHGEAVKGTDYAALVRRYSKYQGPQSPDGDVGFVSMGSLQPLIKAGIDSLEVGQISEVLPNQSGYNIFKVLDRKPEHAYTARRDQGRAARRGGADPVQGALRRVDQGPARQGQHRVPVARGGTASAPSRRRSLQIVEGGRLLCYFGGE